jgi:hypothetical protein
MPYAEGARFDSSKGCLPGTREGIINRIVEWINSSDGESAQRIFFLSGVAGSGKSTIAHAVAKLFYEQKRLGSSYCFARDDQGKRHPRNLFSTIALDIADLDSQWKQFLCKVVGGDRALRTSAAPRDQFQRFILDPSAALTTVGPILIVIDGLDESGNDSSRKPILDVLATDFAKLPPNFRILVTSRPEPDIVQSLDIKEHVRWERMDNIDKASTDADISLFIQTQLSGIRDLELEWPKQEWCDMLLKASDSLFQWASTACLAIKGSTGGLSASEQLRAFISAARGLDGLYLQVLSQAFDVNNGTVLSRFRNVMGRILAAREPLSMMCHSELRAEDDHRDIVGLIVRPLGSLLSGVHQDNVPLRALHASFFDFLMDKRRSRAFYVDPLQQNGCLSMSCLRVMKTGLKFNICKLKTSHVRNSDVPNLDSLIKEYIPPHLHYACRAWVDHLLATAYSSEAAESLRFFLRRQLLYWLEVLSLIKAVSIAPPMLLSVSHWAEVRRWTIDSMVSLLTKVTSRVTTQIYRRGQRMPADSYRHLELPSHRVLRIYTCPLCHSLHNIHKSHGISYQPSPECSLYAVGKVRVGRP